MCVIFVVPCSGMDEHHSAMPLLRTPPKSVHLVQSSLFAVQFLLSALSAVQCMLAMPFSLLAEYGAGVSFGAALFASGVYSPAVISAQLQLTNFHMIKSFMTASAASA